jgi:hypothetical protein
MTDDGNGKYPGVESAFAFVVPSYEIMATRYDAADARLGASITWTVSLTTAVPAIARLVAPQIRFDSAWFICAIGLFAVAMVVGVWARIDGRLTVADPAVHYRKNLKESAWEFKKNAIYFAGRHMAKNADAIERKGAADTAVNVLLALQAALFVLWIATA